VRKQWANQNNMKLLFIYLRLFLYQGEEQQVKAMALAIIFDVLFLIRKLLKRKED
jgi:hypothetical protein